ncbi:methyltransferase domain-containing protein [Clostridiaceae bacterium]|nr:methyltransferase domain-containing protein [Clostridiaceae bacterium]
MKEKLIIYGTGNFGKRLYECLRKFDISVYCFCQTQIENGEDSLYEIPIISLHTLTKISGDKLILIAIENSQVSNYIKTNLMNQFLEDAKIFECGNFIKSNLNSFVLNENQYCLMCNSYIKEFIPSGNEGKIFLEHHIIGGGYRKNCVCPQCNSMDRTRWVLYVLKKYTRIFNEPCRVLHFAPEDGLVRRIQANIQCDYYTCDIESGKAMHVVDVTDIPFRDHVFDYIIINHVLEHIENESLAVSELKRVLKPDGKIILSFPICMNQKTLEDLSIKTKEKRQEIYGQEDHVRLYGYDFKEWLEQYGLKIKVYSPKEELSLEEITRYGLICDDICMVCSF